VDRSEETVVITVKQRQRRRSSLSGRNSYLESMETSSPPSNKKESTNPLSKSNGPNQKPTNRSPRGIAGSYLDSLNSPPPAVDSQPNSNNSNNHPKDNDASPRIAPKGIAGNYLESLSSSASHNAAADESYRRFAVPSDALSQNPYVEEVRGVKDMNAVAAGMQC
jgi:hypothetical protein